MPTNALASSAQENLTVAQEMLASATTWVSTNGIKFALALLGALAIYLIGTWVAGLIRSTLINSLNRRGTDQTVNTYIANILHGLILVLVIVTALGQLGIPTAQFAALIAAAGLATIHREPFTAWSQAIIRPTLAARSRLGVQPAHAVVVVAHVGQHQRVQHGSHGRGRA
jgi:hypothetical protein